MSGARSPGPIFPGIARVFWPVPNRTNISFVRLAALRGIGALCVFCCFCMFTSCDAPDLTFSQYPPSILEAPVFYELAAERFGDRENLTLLSEDKVRLAPLGTFDVKNFDWKTHNRTDQSFWIRMERNDYLLPLLDRWSGKDQEFLERWITVWLDVHEKEWLPNKGAHDDMGIGKRGMVLAWYIRRLRQSETDNVELLERLTRSIQEHQTHLEKKNNFTMESNHGMWEALGLFETTRVIENPEVTALSLKRLVRVARLSVSDQGFHREHSPSYHFYFLGWLDEIVPYLESLNLQWAALDSLATLHSRMRAMTYYLYDHGLNVPQIGDTDATTLEAEPSGLDASEMARSVLDRKAGYAIFKDPESAVARRYVVFNCQNKQELPAMRHHSHDDVLAVYYADDGEVIFGDTGRYSYTKSPIRTYVRSAAAHNTIIRRKTRGGQASELQFADEVREVPGEGRAFFEATLWGGLITRSVEIPFEGRGLTVRDRIVANDIYSALWHIGHDVERIEDLPPRVDGDADVYGWRLTTRKGRTFDLVVTIESDSTSGDPTVEVVRGLENPYRGWYSSGYEVWEPATLLSVTVAPGGWASITMEIAPR